MLFGSNWILKLTYTSLHYLKIEGRCCVILEEHCERLRAIVDYDVKTETRD
jgi:hypothetical protein